MPKKLSVQEIKAVAETAITAQHALAAAKTALDAAPDDESLKSAYESAQTTATEAKAKADALSQTDTSTMSPEQIAKAKRKMAAIRSDLRQAGALEDDDDEDDDDDDEDPNRPVTFADLQRIEARKATQTASSMADAIEDPLLRDAVKTALNDVKPSGDPAADLKKAVAIANIDKHDKVLEEFGRRVVPVQHRNGAGAPARPAEVAFVATAEEANYMRPPFNMTQKDILAARKLAEQQ